MASEATHLLAQFLDWVDGRPRSVAEARTAWSSTCPLNCAWEDALCEDLIAIGGGSVRLTQHGRARLAATTQSAAMP
jgi:hypothetical protein